MSAYDFITENFIFNSQTKSVDELNSFFSAL